MQPPLKAISLVIACLELGIDPNNAYRRKDSIQRI